MAGDIKGITIEIGGDTSKLQKSIKEVDKQLKETKSSLKDVNKLLKLDPSNTELLRQKQKLLKEAIDQTKVKLQALKDEQKNVAEGSDKWNKLQRDINQTEQELAKLENEYREFGSVAAQQIKVAGEKMQKFGDKVGKVADKLMPISKTAAGIGAGLLALGYKALDTADDLNTLSKQTGLTTDEIQQMQYASELVDVSFDDMNGALKKLKKNMTGQSDTWEKLGISVTDTNGNMRNATDVFYESLEALSQIENETERDQVAMTLFGKSADQLAGIIDDGGKALKEYGQQAKDLGLIMDGETLDSMNTLKDTVDELKGNFGATFIQLGASVATVLAPALEKLSEKLKAVAERIRKLTPEQTELILKIVGITAAVAPALKAFSKLTKTFGNIMTKAPKLVKAFSLLTSPVGLVVAGIAAAIAIGVLLYKNWDKIKDAANKLKDNLTKTWNDIKTSVVSSVNQTKDDAIKSWNTLKTSVIAAMTNLKTTVVNIWNTLKTSVTTIVNNIKTSVVNSWNNIKTSVTTVVNSTKTSVVNAWNNVKTSVVNVVNSTKTSVVNAWNNIKTSVTNAVNSIKTAAVNAWNNIKSSVASVCESIKSTAVEKWNSMKSAVVGVVDSLSSSVTGKISAIKNSAQMAWISIKNSAVSKWNDLKSSVIGIVEGLKSRLASIVEGIKSLFRFQISIPKLNIGGGGSVGVTPYASAYDNPVMFTSPTVLATPGGLKQFGDGNGAEIVMGLNKLRELVGGTGVTINVYPAQGMDVNQLADQIQDRFVALQKQRSLANA